MFVKLILISFLITMSVQDKQNQKKENKGLNEMYVPTSMGQ